MAPTYDPTKPDTWTGDQRKDYLGALGLTWISGEGPRAVWRTPAGNTIDEGSALIAAMPKDGEAGKPFEVPAPTATKNPAAPKIEYDPTGRAFYWDTSYGNTPVQQFLPQLDDPTKASGYRAATGGAAPRQGDPDLAANQAFAREQQQGQQAFTGEQNDLNRAATERQQAQSGNIATQQLMQQMHDSEVTQRQSDANLKFLQDKFAVETSANQSAAARETQRDIWNQQRDIAQQQFQYNQMATQVAQFNATQQIAVDEENQRRLEAQQARKAQLATDIGTTAQDAGSRGKLAAYLLANPGLGELDSSLQAGNDFFDKESLAPLGTLLDQRADANKAPNFLSFNPIQAPQAPGFGTPTAFGQGPNGQTDITANPNAPWQTAPGTSYKPTYAPPAGYSSVSQSDFDKMAAIAAQSGGTQAVANPNASVEGLAGGGISDGMYLGDEQGSELHIPLGPGQALVIPHDQVKNFLRMTSGASGGSTAADIQGMGEQLHGMASGGLFDEGSIYGDAPLPDDTQSRDFLRQALGRGLTGTPWQRSGRAPTPVAVSSPGTDQLIQQLGASLQALQSGLPQETFLRRAMALTPQGITAGAGGLRRTA